MTKSSLILLPLSPSPSLGAQAQTAPAPAASAPAAAEVKSDWTITGNAGVFSDYRFRGISQTNKKPAFQGGFDIGHASGFYVGNWNSNVDSALYNGANLEMDFYGGYKMPAGPVALDFGALYYYYPGSGAGGTFKIDNTELYISGGFGPVSMKYSHAISDFFGVDDSKNSWYLEGNGSYEIGNGFSIIGHLGYQKLKGNARVIEMGCDLAPGQHHRLEDRRHLRPERLPPRRGVRRHQPRPDRRHRCAQQPQHQQRHRRAVGVEVVLITRPGRESQ